MDLTKKPPNCLKCVYFRIDWSEKVMARCCEVFEIKSIRMPSNAVLEATGRICPSFELKEGLK